MDQRTLVQTAYIEPYTNLVPQTQSEEELLNLTLEMMQSVVAHVKPGHVLAITKSESLASVADQETDLSQVHVEPSHNLIKTVLQNLRKLEDSQVDTQVRGNVQIRMLQREKEKLLHLMSKEPAKKEDISQLQEAIKPIDQELKQITEAIQTSLKTKKDVFDKIFGILTYAESQIREIEPHTGFSSPRELVPAIEPPLPITPIQCDRSEWFASVEGNDLTRVTALLLGTNTVGGKTADPKWQNRDGNTALIVAASMGHSQIVTKLLEKGVKLDIQGKSGQTALMSACEHGFTKVAKQIINEGCNLNLEDKKGNSALIYAAQTGSLAIVQTLIEKQAKLSNSNKEGHTALFYAAQGGFREIESALFKAGAKKN